MIELKEVAIISDTVQTTATKFFETSRKNQDDANRNGGRAMEDVVIPRDDAKDECGKRRFKFLRDALQSCHV
jgi:hypothetical protein